MTHKNYVNADLGVGEGLGIILEVVGGKTWSLNLRLWRFEVPRSQGWQNHQKAEFWKHWQVSQED